MTNVLLAFSAMRHLLVVGLVASIDIRSVLRP